MDVNLLRSKMALKGHFTWAELAEVVGVSRPSLTARLDGSVDWTVPEMRRVILEYDLSEEDACRIFGLKSGHED